MSGMSYLLHERRHVLSLWSVIEPMSIIDRAAQYFLVSLHNYWDIRQTVLRHSPASKGTTAPKNTHVCFDHSDNINVLIVPRKHFFKTLVILKRALTKKSLNKRFLLIKVISGSLRNDCIESVLKLLTYKDPLYPNWFN